MEAAAAVLQTSSGILKRKTVLKNANNFSSRGQLLAHGSLRELSISSDIWTGKAFLTGYTLQE